jgi:hypothetical protein
MIKHNLKSQRTTIWNGGSMHCGRLLRSPELLFLYYINQLRNQPSRCSIVVSIPPCQLGDPGSIPFFLHFRSVAMR